jgi:hypothetical protein
MKTLYSLLIAFAFLCACSPPERLSSDAIRQFEKQIADDALALSDTVLTFSRWEAGSINEVIWTLYIDKDGETKCYMKNTRHCFMDTAVFRQFYWMHFFNAKDRINTQKPMPYYVGKVIEGDTIWSITKPLIYHIYEVKIYVPGDVIAWKTNDALLRTNPSMASSQLVEYLINYTLSNYNHGKGKYGKRRKQRKYTLEN